MPSPRRKYYRVITRTASSNPFQDSVPKLQVWRFQCKGRSVNRESVFNLPTDGGLNRSSVLADSLRKMRKLRQKGPNHVFSAIGSGRSTDISSAAYLRLHLVASPNSFSIVLLRSNINSKNSPPALSRTSCPPRSVRAISNGSSSTRSWHASSDNGPASAGSIVPRCSHLPSVPTAAFRIHKWRLR